MIMGNFKKMYVGAIDKQEDAALLYDKVAILTHGLKVIPIAFSSRTCRLKLILTTQSLTLNASFAKKIPWLMKG